MSVVFNAIVMTALWNHMWFADLQSNDLIGPDGQGSLATQVLFLTLGFAMAVALARTPSSGLASLLSKTTLALVAWLAISSVLSVDIAVTARRLILFAIAAMLSIGMLLVAKSQRELAQSLALASLAILVPSYLGVVLAPDLTIHSAYDIQGEPSHAGLWRGVFPHKNETGAAMVIILIGAMFISSVYSAPIGAIVFVGALGFLAASYSKTALLLLPVILGISFAARVFRSGTARALILLAPMLTFAVVSVGSVLFPAVRTTLQGVMFDASFTGRADVWEFAIASIMNRPIVGWGFGAFWRTEKTMFAGSEVQTWATTASHAHNAFLDAALIGGLPLLALTILLFVLLPIRDLQASTGRGDISPANLFFIRLWLLGAFSASFESVLYNGNNATCCMLIMAVAGLRLSTRYKPV